MRFFVYILILAAGCVGTPVPEPPNLTPPDPALVEVNVGSVPGITGQPGALEPGTELWIANLDNMDPPTRIPTRDDGSFRDDSFVAAPGQELRLQARRGAERSIPVDVRAGGGEVMRPTAGCLVLRPALELNLDDPETASRVVIENGCGVDARIDDIRLRAPSASIRVDTAPPLMIPDGASANITLSLLPDATGLTEEVLILDVSAPETDRRPVTVFARRP
ncbi:MAG: hypothetical protein GXP55_22605 [Deltaproteobacteria bacterium]|nr:hypothetical protein [Deltaproteobacteria bacterium]